MSTTPIEDYALLSDSRSAALVSRDGSVDWLCFPRFDSPSVFGRLLDADAGYWSIRPIQVAEISRRYIDGTMVLETTFRTAEAEVVLTDAMAVGPNEQGHQLARASPGALVRRVDCRQGSIDMVYEFVPRPEYGLIYPLLSHVEGGLLARGGADILVLGSHFPLHIDGSAARAYFSLEEGEHAGFSLQHAWTWGSVPTAWGHDDSCRALGETISAWQSWSDMHQGYVGPWKDLVRHSGRVLQALTFQPTGAIVAAATTSLPEAVGGSRNWDYRYTWVRDASLTLMALWVAACPDEAQDFFSWMATAAAARIRETDLQIMFGVGGEHDLSERELSHLRGWRGSQPVRIGNGAWNQRQLDVYGELLSAANLLSGRIEQFDDATNQFLVEVADTAAHRWREKDQGIWEVRGEPRDFLYSKLMCWVAMDSAIALASRLDAADRVPGWTSTREDIREAILAEGFSDRAGAFTQFFGSDDLDASALMIPIVGFLPASDPRMKSTIAAIADRLTDKRGLVYRYRSHDGLAGEEGTFLICTFWLAHAQALAGELDAARATMERTIAHVNDVGLLSEEVGADGEFLGNFPQAFSHIGLVNAAWAIAQAEAAEAR